MSQNTKSLSAEEVEALEKEVKELRQKVQGLEWQNQRLRAKNAWLASYDTPPPDDGMNL